MRKRCRGKVREGEGKVRKRCKRKRRIFNIHQNLVTANTSDTLAHFLCRNKFVF